MKVFKFGGASVKDADAVKNVASIVKRYDEKLGIVVSAMGRPPTPWKRSLRVFGIERKKNSGNSLRNVVPFI
jgi:aspartate kinase